MIECFAFTFRILQHFNAGMVAGFFTTTIMAPGERVKCLMQVRTTKYINIAILASPYSMHAQTH